jgi:hypothetical protein
LKDSLVAGCFLYPGLSSQFLATEGKMGSIGPCRYYDREFDTILIDLDDTLYRVEEIPLTVRQNISGAWHPARVHAACKKPAFTSRFPPNSISQGWQQQNSWIALPWIPTTMALLFVPYSLWGFPHCAQRPLS